MFNIKKALTKIMVWVKEKGDLIGNSSMGTSASTITGAIAEHESDISNLNSNINHKVPLYSFTINNDFPTASDIQNFFSLETSIEGAFVLQFNRAGHTRSSMIYSAVNNKYGGGLIFTHYDDKFAKIINTNGTVTITVF